MERLFHIFISLVFILSIFFGVLIWRQTIKFEKKALAAKKRKEEFIHQFEIEQKQAQKVPVINNNEISLQGEDSGHSDIGDERES